MSTVVTLEEFPAILESPFQWRFQSGVKPSIARIPFMREDAKEIIKRFADVPFASRRRVTLTINGQEIKGLFVLGELQAEHPDVSIIEVADVRAWWSYSHTKRSYNIRRAVGFKRRKDWNEDLQVDVQPDIDFAPWSLNKGVEWDSLAVINDQLESDDALGWIGFKFSVEPSVKSLKAMPIEGLEVDERSDSAMKRVLGFLPGADIKVDADGQVIVYSKIDGSEDEVIFNMQELFDGPRVIEQTNAAVRPSEIRVLFTREVEVRFDFIQQPVDGTRAGEGEARTIRNVIPVPDFSLTVGGRDVAQGTYVEEVDLIVRYATDFNVSATQLDEAIRVSFLPGLDLWAPLILTGDSELTAVKANNAARISAIQRHYRQTYRINPKWHNRIRSIKDYLVATIDPETGQRAPAVAFMDHSIVPSAKSHLLSARKQIQGQANIIPSAELTYLINVKGYPTTALGPLRKDEARPAPARIKVEDEDQGIVRLEFLLDPYGLEQAVLPSTVDNVPAVSTGAGRRTSAISFDAVTEEAARNFGVPQLSQSHKLAIVLTVIPGSPNNRNQFHEVVVKPKDVAKLLPREARKGLNEAYGPPMYLRVGPGIETARVAWSDDSEAVDAIEKIFGAREGKLKKEVVEKLTINSSENRAGAASLQRIAESMAASEYARMTDRLIGARQQAGAEAITPTGSIQNVEIAVAGDGSVTTTANLPDELPRIEPFALLDNNTRRIVLKRVNRKG